MERKNRRLKKVISVLLALCIVVISPGGGAKVWGWYVSEQDGFRIYCDNGTIRHIIAGYNGSDAHITIPEKCSDPLCWCGNRHYITDIEKGAFAGCSVQSITIHKYISTIEIGAFDGCSTLKEIRFVDGSQYYYSKDGILYYKYGKNDLVRCPEGYENAIITLDTLAVGVEKIRTGAFRNCVNLESITIPKTVTSIGKYAFEGCTNLKEVNYVGSKEEWYKLESTPWIEKGVTINYNVDSDNYEYRVLEDGTIVITGYNGDAADLYIPLYMDGKRVARIEKSAFAGNTSLTDITIPEGATIEEGAFSGSDLETISVHNGVHIEKNAFSDCSGLESVSVQEGVQIEEYAFAGCNRLTSISVSEGVQIEERAFDKCSKLAEVVISWDTLNENGGFARIFPSAYSTIGSVKITDTEGETGLSKNTVIGDHVLSGCSGLKSVSLPGSVKQIGAGAFSGCSGLSAIALPEKVTTIEEGAFSGCSGLEKITLPGSVKQIGANAFSGCSGLKSVSLPESVKQIGANAFSDCSGLSTITLPERVIAIEEGVFSGCSSLRNVRFSSLTDEIGSWAFAGCSGLVTIALPERLTTIEEGAFSDCSGLEKITLPESVKQIGAGAFSGCSGLETVALPKGVTSIEDGTFQGCGSLRDVRLSGSTDRIGSRVFAGCSSLKSIDLPGGVSDISSEAFADSGIQFVYYAAGIEQWAKIPNSGSISQKVYEHCISSDYEYTQSADGTVTITGYTGTDKKIGIPPWLGGEVTCIDGKAFDGCKGIESLCIPKSVTNIEESALSGCNGLSDIFYEGSEKQWKAMYGIVREPDGVDMHFADDTKEPYDVYTVSFNSYGLAGIPSQTVTQYDLAVEPQTVPERSGFRFIGWYAGESEWNFEGDKVRGNMTLNARWEVASEPVRYINGVMVDAWQTRIIPVGKEFTVRCVPSYDMKVSVRWTNQTPDILLSPNISGSTCLTNTVKAVREGVGKVVAIVHSEYWVIPPLSNELVQWDVKDEPQEFSYRVVSYVSSIDMNRPQMQMKEGETYLLDYSTTPDSNYSRAVSSLSFRSSDTKVATVSRDEHGWGLVTAEGPGTAVITISADNAPGVSAVCYVTVAETGEETPPVASQNPPGSQPPVSPSPTGSEQPSGDYAKGDVNNDTKVTLADAQMALKAALNLMALDKKQIKAADVDGNGKVELKDAQKILKVALNLDKFDKTAKTAQIKAALKDRLGMN